ncbi:MAG: class C beta-lactamase-related serine hydrolase [Rhodospirillaceae bacterium]|nr:class C beta-lactamase-related serine hydrolase [Rhodospirillaceae bacterium]
MTQTVQPRKLDQRAAIAAVAVYALAALAVVDMADNWIFWTRYLNPPPNPFEWPDWAYDVTADMRADNPSTIPTATPEQAGFAAPGLEQAAAWAEQNESVALIVAHRGAIVLERYWKGVSASMLYSGRSMSKSLNGIIYGIAAHEGYLALEDPIGRYLHEWVDDKRGQITVRQVLENTSGLENLGFALSPFNKLTQLSWGAHIERAALSFELENPPGIFFAISNTGSQLLGVILERATGQTYHDYFNDKIWRPIGAEHGSFYMDRPGGMAHTDCCFRAHPRDWIRLGELLRNDGVSNGARILPEGWVKQVTTASKVNPNHGLHMWLGSPYIENRTYIQGRPSGGERLYQSEPYLADDVFFMEGGGNRMVWIIPSKELTIVRLGTSSKTWDSAAIPNAVMRAMSP